MLTEILKEANVEMTDEVKATISVCSNTARALLEEVLNIKYFPIADPDSIAYVLSSYVEYVTINSLYFYCPNMEARSALRSRQIDILRKIETYCVEDCILYILDEDNLVQNMVRYLLDMFYEIH